MANFHKTFEKTPVKMKGFRGKNSVFSSLKCSITYISVTVLIHWSFNMITYERYDQIFHLGKIADFSLMKTSTSIRIQNFTCMSK